ncbi:hypothetical protein MNBD_GAMMA16-1464 [hydrothermal vent metagenome]|uniref:4a-hydroxytetrahydrobiopterin dehydratase n=1 Tax=hydrothermal vent metagenome TaxID=652676 RepID=A0A3B0Z4T4_9ZZZZ
MSSKWLVRKKPARLERRIDFSDYEETREFLDQAADLAESEDYYPDMSFGRTHVSITIHLKNDESEVSEYMWRYAQMIDEFVPAEKKDL